MGDKGSGWKAAWAAGRLAARRVVGRAAGAADRELGERLAAELDQMKGLGMKLGQIVSYMDVPLPAEAQAALAKLQQGNFALPPEEFRAALEAGLRSVGVESIEAALVDLGAEPVAAASIGEVHRARLRAPTGAPEAFDEVAVKVRYPGVENRFEGDLAGVRRMASLARFVSTVDGEALVRELGERLTIECDYGSEATWQAAFRDFFAGDDDLKIPRIVGSLSSVGVLISEWVEAQTFDAFRATAEVGERRRIAEAMVRFGYRSMLVAFAIQADPHPGNFLIRSREGGPQLVCLDFGCVRELPRDMAEATRAQTEALWRGDEPAFRAASEAMGLIGTAKRFDYDHLWRQYRHMFAPFLREDFVFDEAYAKDTLRYNGPTNPNARKLGIPAPYMWIARLQWGLWAVVKRLEVEGGYGEVLEEILAETPKPLSRPDGTSI